MSRVFFRKELEGVATFWRIYRRDGVTLGFTSHDRDIWFDGVLHRAAPGMVPSAIRRNAGFAPDSAEMQGPLSHGSIGNADLTSGRFDDATVEIGAVDWETLDRAILYNGNIGSVASHGNGFAADLVSSKARLEADPVPRTSPTCRARFCGPGCTLPASRFSREARLSHVGHASNRMGFDLPDHGRYLYGELRWIDGPHVGAVMQIVDAEADALYTDMPLSGEVSAGMRVILREGCDHTIATCADRFANAVNFQGEPFLPGNDLLMRYPVQP
ncbi:DUF2163 domain-containing protein [Pseudopontixanthobacter vadosimaris]|uniref:DUF2163 domain-containing protein n=1 Tax=Pseudopontixanthobacter vadosimaris TaxID=2726450 RepID=UPI0014762956|nr:DUF2163 domain-containing protein [Pseudopontixanthobacter vadosimaris]